MQIVLTFAENSFNIFFKNSDLLLKIYTKIEIGNFNLKNLNISF